MELKKIDRRFDIAVIWKDVT